LIYLLFKIQKATTNCVQTYTFNENRSEASSKNVCSADIKDSLGKE
jgi:hypothetical protein